MDYSDVRRTKDNAEKIPKERKPYRNGLYREAQFEGLSAGGTIRLWRYSTVGNGSYTSYTFTGKLDLGDVHLTGMYLSNVYLIGVYLIGV
jgi:hypothetical protein